MLALDSNTTHYSHLSPNSHPLSSRNLNQTVSLRSRSSCSNSSDKYAKDSQYPPECFRSTGCFQETM
ncbi:hypothetical protein HanRHA438_Chr17g0800651 [Helianthus annuus]|nr:hypothetical protein HanRHA438_Chr17g0800651 [Helianthus annuus]